MRPILLLVAAIAAAPASLAHARPASAPDLAAACAKAAASPRAEPVFGCASALNLRLMVADPRDLERGASLGPAVGDAALAAAERHRQGQVKPLGGAGSQASAGSGGGQTPEGR